MIVWLVSVSLRQQSRAFRAAWAMSSPHLTWILNCNSLLHHQYSASRLGSCNAKPASSSPIITGQSFWCQADSVSLTAMLDAQFQKKEHTQQAENSLATDTQTRGPSSFLKMVCKTPSSGRVHLICCGIRVLLPNCMLKPEAASALPHGWAHAM